MITEYIKQEVAQAFPLLSFDSEDEEQVCVWFDLLNSFGLTLKVSKLATDACDAYWQVELFDGDSYEHSVTTDKDLPAALRKFREQAVRCFAQNFENKLESDRP